MCNGYFLGSLSGPIVRVHQTPDEEVAAWVVNRVLIAAEDEARGRGESRGWVDVSPCRPGVGRVRVIPVRRVEDRGAIHRDAGLAPDAPIGCRKGKRCRAVGNQLGRRIRLWIGTESRTGPGGALR